jgi:hypothetical protein
MNKHLYFLLALISALIAIKTNTFVVWVIIVFLTQVGLGTFIAFLLDILTAGYAKDIAGWVANKLGYQSCGCDEREALLNKYTKINIKYTIKF